MTTRDVEGYPGLLTHGPLQALVMAEAARAARPNDGTDLLFDYKLTSLLFDFQGLVVSAVAEQHATATAVRDIRGRQTATGVLRGSR